MIRMRAGDGRRAALVAATVASLLAGCSQALPRPGPTEPSASPSVAQRDVKAKTNAKAKATQAPSGGAGEVRLMGPTHIDGAPAAYFTFDDGPDPGSTDLVLDELARRNTPATFFVLGQFMVTQAQQDLIKRELTAGNAVAAHGWTHPDMKAWEEQAVLAEIRRIRERIVEQTGSRPSCMRPPYGSVTENVQSAARRENLFVQLWDIDTQDWARPNAQEISAAIMRDLKPGSVILMHDGRGHGKVAAQVVRSVVDAATKRGFRFGQLCPMAPSQ